jgi:hypothetical protein
LGLGFIVRVRVDLCKPWVRQFWRTFFQSPCHFAVIFRDRACRVITNLGSDSGKRVRDKSEALG